MSNKKRVAKHSNQKRYARASRAILRNVAAARIQSQIEDGYNTHLFNTNTCKQIKPNDIIAKAFVGVKFKWAIWAGVFCRDQFNKEYMQGEWIITNQHYLHSEISEYIADRIDNIVNQANQQHIIDIGWIANTQNEEIEKDTLTKIFTNYGAWEGLSQWEQSKEQAA